MREFRLQISNIAGQKISFGKRLLGSVGRDITAVKVALGAIKEVGLLTELPSQEENVDIVDPNSWLDCTTGEEITPAQAATFDKSMQLRLMKFQLDHQLLIISYLFHKFGVAELINESMDFGSFGRQFSDAMEGLITRSSPRRIEYKDLSAAGKRRVHDEVALDVVNSVTNLFAGELGSLDEATLAVLHGWVPQARYGNESYYHTKKTEGSESVIDIIPSQLLEQYIEGELTQKPTSNVSRETIDAYRTQNAADLAAFNNSAPESYKWNPEAGFGYGTIKYKFKDQFTEGSTKRTSPLYAATLETIEAIRPTPAGEQPLSSEETQGFLERALQPDPLTDPDPFIVDSKRIGFFGDATLPDGTPFTVENMGDWISIKETPETIARLEDIALAKVLQFYEKPDIWYLYKESLEMQERYFVVGSDPPSPEHSSLLPHNKAEEDRHKYWVLATNKALSSSNIQPTATQHYSEIEGINSQEPLIKFVEYRIPSFRQGDPYRVYFEINREKLDLITEGYSISELEAAADPASTSTGAEGTLNSLSEQLSAICEDLSPEENDRRYEEFRALAAKNRREIIRRIREATLQAHQSSSAAHTLDLEFGNVLGPALEDTPFGQYLGPFGNLELSDGRYAQHLGGAIASVVSDIRTDMLNDDIAKTGRAPGTAVRPDTAQLTTLNISWSSLKQRVGIITKDLKEANKHATEEGFTFDPSDFNPIQEGKNLDKIVSRIETLIKNKYPSGWPGFDKSNSFMSSTPILSALSDADVNVTINFAFVDVDGITETRILSIKTINDIYNLPDDDASPLLPKEFKKPIATGYLSQIFKMTTSWTGQAEAQVAKNPAGCADLGAVKNGVAYLTKYSFGLKAKREKKDGSDAAWHEGWADRHFKAPVKEWMKQTTKNLLESGDPANFGTDETLALIGETCTWPKIWKEFIDKIDLKMLLCDYLKCIGLPGVAIKAPSLNIPPVPKMPIFGWYVGFVKFIKKKWKEIITRLLCTIVRLLIDFLTFPLCDEQFKEAFGNAGQYSPVMKQALADALFRLPLEPGDEEKAKDFVDDAFRTLRGDEICRLLNGELLDGAAMAMLERLAAHRGLDTSFSNREDLLEFFSVIAGFVPSSLCDRLNGLDEIAGGATCKDSTDRLEELRRRFEANDDVTEEEIAEALAMAHKNLMDNETAMQALLDNGLASMAGNYVELGNDDALINALPDTIDKAIKRTAKSTFERAKMAYIGSLTSYVPGLSIPSTRLARPGDPSYNATAVMTIEAALKNLQDFQELTATLGGNNIKNINSRFLTLYQVYEAEYAGTGASTAMVHAHYKSQGGEKLSHSEFLAESARQDEHPDDLPKLKPLSYSKQISGLLNPTESLAITGLKVDPNFIDESGEMIPIDTSKYGVDYVGQVLMLPHRSENMYAGTERGPFSATRILANATVTNPDFVPEDAREGWGDELRTTSRKLQNTWLDENLPDWTAFRQLESIQAKEMFMLNRIQELTNIIVDNLSEATGTETSSEYMHILKDIFDASIEASLEGTENEQIEMDSTQSLRMQADLGPFKPSVFLREYISSERRDSYVINVSDRFLFPDSSTTGETFEYCDLIPQEYTTTVEGEPLNIVNGNTYAKRAVFSQHVLKMIGDDLTRYGFPDIPASEVQLWKPLMGKKHTDTGGSATGQRSLYKLAFEGILESVFFKLRDSPMFSEEYAAGLHDRLSGKYILETGCDTNRYNLNHFGILSFDEMVTDEIPDLVSMEMSRPENQPQNLDYNMPGPIEKAIQMATLKGYIRVCLVEVMLKGAIPYSVWDMEAVVGDQFYIDYVHRYVLTQLQKHDSIRDYWGPVAEKMAGISGATIALRSLVQEELHPHSWLPNLSKLIFDNKDPSYAYMDFLTKESTNIIPNVNIPKSYVPAPAREAGYPVAPMWMSQHALRANPFLSVEHYVKMSGSLADLRRAIPTPDRASAALLDTFDSLLYPGESGDQTIYNVVNGLSPFWGGERDAITTAIQNMASANFGDDILNMVSQEIVPIMEDRHEDKEIYHIDELASVMQAINSRVNIFDTNVAPAFGFLGTYPADPAESFLAAEVLRRTPSRFIRRKRKTFKLSSNTIFDPREQSIKDLVSIEPNNYNSLINFSGMSIMEDLRSQVAAEDSIAQESERFYIIPADFWHGATADETYRENLLGITSPDSLEPGEDPLEPSSDAASKFYRGWTSKITTIAGDTFDPLDPAAPWLSGEIFGNDSVYRNLPDNTREALFRNIYGKVSEATYDAAKDAVNDRQWRSDVEEGESRESIVTEETWNETVIDFVGDASMVFSVPGESLDQAIETWAHDGTPSSTAAWNDLKKYLNQEEIDALRAGSSSNFQSTLVVDKHPALRAEIAIGPGHAMGFNPREDLAAEIDANYSGVIVDKIPNADFTQRGRPGTNNHRAEIFELEKSISNAIKKNDYKVPLRLLVTQIEIDGSIRQVYSRIVLPTVLSTIRTDPEGSISSRRNRLDLALAKIFRDYIEMIEEGYENLVNNGLTNLQDPTPNDKYNEVSAKYKQRMRVAGLSTTATALTAGKHRSFPVLLRQENLIYGNEDIYRPGFCSVPKIYSVACQEEVRDSNGVFSNGENILDSLFAERGYLMKDNRSELGTIPKYFGSPSAEFRTKGIVEKYTDYTVGHVFADLRQKYRDCTAAHIGLLMAESAGQSFAEYATKHLSAFEKYDSNVVERVESLIDSETSGYWPGMHGADMVNEVFMRTLGLYYKEMKILFSGQSHMWEFHEGAEDINSLTSGWSSCEAIGDLLNALAPEASWPQKIQLIPEPFRSAVSVGCFNAGIHQNADFASNLDFGDSDLVAFDTNIFGETAADVNTAVENLTEKQNKDFFEFVIRIFYASHTEAAKTFTRVRDTSSGSEELVWRLGNTPREILGEERLAVETGTTGPVTDFDSAAERFQYAIRHALGFIFSYEAEEALNKINFLGEAGTNTSDRFNTTNIEISEGYRHAMALKTDQRTGLNYLYQYNLRDFFDPGTNFSASGRGALDNKERCNKVALSISNILTWFSQKRSESFSGMTSHPSQIQQEPFSGHARGRASAPRPPPRRGYTTTSGVFVEVTRDQWEAAAQILRDDEQYILSGQGSSAAAGHRIDAFNEQNPDLEWRSVIAESLVRMEAGEEISFSDLEDEFGASGPGSAVRRADGGYIPLSSPRRGIEERIQIPYSIETPGVMCGFSPFAGDGRYHIEEFLEAYKQYFLQINQVTPNQFTDLRDNPSQNSPVFQHFWAPKVNFFWFVNAFTDKILETHFIKDYRGEIFIPLPGHEKQYIDFKYSQAPFTDRGSNEQRAVGLFVRPSDKYENIARMLELYRFQTEEFTTIVNHGQKSNQNLGAFKTELFINTELSHLQQHLLRTENLLQIQATGYPEMTSDQKVFIFHPKRFELQTRLAKQIDHFAVIAKKEVLDHRTFSRITPEISIFNDSLSMHHDGFAFNQSERMLNTSIRPLIRTAGEMLSQQWQCMLESTGLFFFYENYRRIYAENLFDSVESLMTDTDIRACSRLMLNIPTEGGSLDATNVENDFPPSHPMHQFLIGFQRHVAGGIGNLMEDPAFVTLSTEERAYRVKNHGSGFTYTLPLAKFETGEPFSLSGHGGNIRAMVDNFNSRKTTRTQRLLETSEAKTVVEYIFPVQRYMALSTAYSTSILGGYNEVPNLMMSTKASLATILHLCSINSRARLDYLEDVSQSEFMKKAQENMTGAGDSAMSCFDFPFNEDMMDQFWEQLKALVKQIPSIILRGIADVLDPAYKEMKIHWNNCDLKNLRNSSWTSNALMNDSKLLSGLMPGPNRGTLQGGPRDPGNGQYVPIIPGATIDMYAGASWLALGAPFGVFTPGLRELRNSILRTLSYVYKGPASLLDPAMAFKIPCLDIDEDFKEKWNHGKYGRYGHPITPFTLLALMTPEINPERIQKAENCPLPPAAPPPPCEDEEE